jgi:single-stranded DNA-binding protein
MLNVLASGTLARDPQQRTSSAGKPYCTVLVRVPVEDAEALLCSVIAFAPDAVRALLALGRGDAVTVAGRAKLSSWQSAGEPRHGLSVVADRVLTAYQAGKARKASQPAEEPADA